MNIVRGQKLKLKDLTPALQFSVEIALNWTERDDIDIACFGLDASGKLSDDRYFIFFNQLQSPEGAVSCAPGGKGKATFNIDLARLPQNIKKLTFTAAIDGASSLSALGSGTLRLLQGGTELLSFAFSGGDFSSEKAAMLFDVYFKDEWRVSAVGQGFKDGLKALLEHFGGEALEAAAAKPAPSTPPAAPVPPVPAAPKISLSKITLEKRGDSKSVDLRKKDGQQKIHINLNWDQSFKKSGLFGSKTVTADLDLGCMFELQDGQKGVIQALGKNFGNQHGAPWIYLDKDDRSGTAADGENLFVLEPDKIRRVLIFAFIYEGAGNFTAVNGRVLVKDSAGNEITIRLDSPESGKTFCAICTLQNTGNALQITKEERYYRHHGEADDHFKFGFNWKAGSK